MLKHVYKPTALKEARRSRGLTAAEVSKLVGLKPSRLGYVEKGQAAVKPEELVALSGLYDLTAAHLSEWIGEKEFAPEPSKLPAAQSSHARSRDRRRCRDLFRLIKSEEM